jgi:hypothetical protein
MLCRYFGTNFTRESNSSNDAELHNSALVFIGYEWKDGKGRGHAKESDCGVFETSIMLQKNTQQINEKKIFEIP